MNASDVAGPAGAPADQARLPAASDFETQFEAHYERIARAIARVIRDPARAEELAVEAFWKLWRNTPPREDAVGGWLYRTAVRLALDELRRSARRSRYERWFAALRPPSTPYDLFSAREEQGRVRVVLAALPRRHSELLLLRHEGLSYAELASSLQLNPASIGTLLSRAQEAFRKEYVSRYGEQI